MVPFFTLKMSLFCGEPKGALEEALHSISQLVEAGLKLQPTKCKFLRLVWLIQGIRFQRKAFKLMIARLKLLRIGPFTVWLLHSETF